MKPHAEHLSFVSKKKFLFIFPSVYIAIRKCFLIIDKQHGLALIGTCLRKISPILTAFNFVLYYL